MVTCTYRPIIQSGSSDQNTVSSHGGNGIIISEDGYIITNHHVVSFESKELDPIKFNKTCVIRVVINNDVYEAKIKVISDNVYWNHVEDLQRRLVSLDEEDLAILKIDAKKKLIPIAWANSTCVKIGDVVLLVRHQRHNHIPTSGVIATSGIISVVPRNIAKYGYDLWFHGELNAVEGDSGAPWIDKDGNMVAVQQGFSDYYKVVLQMGIPSNRAILFMSKYQFGPKEIANPSLCIDDIDQPAAKQVPKN